MSLLPDSFAYQDIDTGEVRIHCAVAGDGPPLLLLHGYPQTHLIWHRVAPLLASEFTVVLADLRGYGDSDKPAPTAGEPEYTKRAMAADQVSLMRQLGIDRFGVVGHDRGGRVAHRMALDTPSAVERLAVLDIVPTRYTFEHVDAAFGLGYFHWFFLADGNGIPERLLAAEPEFWIRSRMNSRHSGGAAFDPAAVDEYVRCFSDPAAIAASCADYRAAANADLVHDNADAGRLLECPLMVLWGEHSLVGRMYDPIEVWRGYGADVTGRALPSDHYVPEEQPELVAAAVREFFRPT
jgi:haloacetate dehalogenase